MRRPTLCLVDFMSGKRFENAAGSFFEIYGLKPLRAHVFRALVSACFCVGAFGMVLACASDAPQTQPTAQSNSTAEETAASSAPEASGPCEQTSYRDAAYVVCRFDPQQSHIRLFLNNAQGEPYGHFNWVSEALAAKGETLAFAMNAGMYHESREPVGLYVEDGTALSAINNNDGPGNFHLKPNGVFFLTDSGAAGVQETTKFETTDQEVAFATQSGPMLVIDGDIHPRFLPESESLKRRNGVGVTESGEVIFVLADAPVRFYDFAMFFRDELQTPNALYLDGSISRLFAPGLGRNDPGVAMGPIVGVVVRDD